MPGITLHDLPNQALSMALDGLSTRQRVISNNLANVDTPGFKASDVSFARQLDRAIAGSGRLSLSPSEGASVQTASDLPEEPQIITRNDTTMRLDGNNVDVDKEMADLAETVIHFQAASQMISRRLAMLRTVINDGRR